MRIDASGNLLLGVTASAGPLTIGKSPPASDIMIDVGNTKYNSTSSSGESKIRFGWENHTGANIAAYKASVNLTGFKFYSEFGYNNPQLVLTVLPDGNLNPEGGVYLGGATGSNLLNDYEEGTFTPTFSTASTYYSQVGIYTKIGNVVTIGIQLDFLQSGSTFGGIGSLPFTISTINYAGISTREYYSTGNFFAANLAVGGTGTSSFYNPNNSPAAASGQRYGFSLTFSYQT